MRLNREGWLGVSLIILTPVLFGVLAHFRALTNLQSVVEQIAAIVLGGMILGGAALVYRGRVSVPQKITETTSQYVEAIPNTLEQRPTRRDEYNARIDRNHFERGEVVFFTVRFRGRLEAGFYEAIIIGPGEKVWYGVDHKTLRYVRAEREGELSGEIDHANWRWGWAIPLNAPFGDYIAHVGVYDTILQDRSTRIRARVLRNWLVGRRILRRKPESISAPDRPAVDQVSVRFAVVRKRDEGESSSLPKIIVHTQASNKNLHIRHISMLGDHSNNQMETPKRRNLPFQGSDYRITLCRRKPEVAIQELRLAHDFLIALYEPEQSKVDSQRTRDLTELRESS